MSMIPIIGPRWDDFFGAVPSKTELNGPVVIQTFLIIEFFVCKDVFWFTTNSRMIFGLCSFVPYLPWKYHKKYVLPFVIIWLVFDIVTWNICVFYESRCVSQCSNGNNHCNMSHSQPWKKLQLYSFLNITF